MINKNGYLNLSVPVTDIDRESFAWKNIYSVGAIFALLVCIIGLLDVVMTFFPTIGNTPGTRTVIDWFSLYHDHQFLALRDLGFFNIITTLSTVMVFFSIYGIHRYINQEYAALTLIILCIGTTIYVSNNICLSMLNLSNQYAIAITESQKSMLVLAGQSLLAQEDVSVGSFIGFFIPEIAGLLMAIIMLKGKIFGRWTAWMGILGETFLAIFNICAAFVPHIYYIAMIFAMIGGPMSIIWFFLIALKLFQLSKYEKKVEGVVTCQG